GSNDLTFFPGFGRGRSLGSGGDRPVEAMAGDFNHDGAADLLVANNGDGRVTLLLGGADGLALARTFTEPGLLHPAAGELSALGGSVLTFYVTDGGEETAIPFVLAFGLPDPPEPEAPVRNPGFTLFGPGFPGGFEIPAVGADEALRLANGGPELRELLGVLTLLATGTVLFGGGDEADADAAALGDPEDELIPFLIRLSPALPATEPA